MNAVVFQLTLQQLLGRRRTAGMALFALVPILLAVVARLNADDIDLPEWAARALYQGMVVGIVLPLVALVVGTAVIGAEFEDGTAVYLLTKPIPRRAIILAKLAAAWLVTAAIVLVAGLVAGGIVLSGEGEWGLVGGFTAANVLGALAYCAVFVMLSVWTSRALVAGLAYVFLWEGVVTGLFRGTRVLSVREYTLAIGDLLAGTPDRIFNPAISAATGIAGIVILTGLMTFYAVRLLERWEMKGE